MRFSRHGYTLLGFAQLLVLYILIKGFYLFNYTHEIGEVIDYRREGKLELRHPLIKTVYQNNPLLFYSKETKIYSRGDVVKVLISPDGKKAFIADFWGFYFSYLYIMACMIWPFFVMTFIPQQQSVELKIKYWKGIPYLHLDLIVWRKLG